MMFEKPFSMVAISIVVMMTTMMMWFWWWFFDDEKDDEGEEGDDEDWQTFKHGRHISPPSTFPTKSVDQFLSPEFSFSSQFHQNMDSESCTSDAGIINQTQYERQDLSSFWLQRSMLSSRSFFFFVMAANSSFNACSLSVTWTNVMFIALQCSKSQ